LRGGCDGWMVLMSDYANVWCVSWSIWR